MAYINGQEVNDAIIVKRLNAPTGTLEITENGVYDVTNYASADVDVPAYNQNLPTGYTQVEYLQNNNGTQDLGKEYINTLRTIGVNDKFYIKFQILTNLSNTPYGSCNVFGVGNDEQNGYNCSIGYSSRGLSISVADTSVVVPYSGGIVEATIDLKNKKVIINGTEYALNYTNPNWIADKPACFFGRYSMPLNNVNGDIIARAKIWSFKKWTNDFIMQDFIPCLNANNVPEFYDVFNRADHKSPTNTNFIYG